VKKVLESRRYSAWRREISKKTLLQNFKI